MVRVNTRELSDNWAYDLHKEPITNGEIWDGDVINQSIEMILSTSPGERVFNPYFGSGLIYKIFEIMTDDQAEEIIDLSVAAIKRWEDRIIVLENEVRLYRQFDKNLLVIYIPYIIKRTGIKSSFQKKIYSQGQF